MITSQSCEDSKYLRLLLFMRLFLELRDISLGMEFNEGAHSHQETLS
jgi:hypothetical protein